MGTKTAVGQPNGTVKGAGVVGTREIVGATGTKVAVGTLGARVGVNVGIAGVNVGVTVGAKVGMTGVKVGATVGVKVGMVGVKVGVRVHHIAPGKTVPVTGSVGKAVGVKVAVGQSEIPPTVVGTVGAKGRVGAVIGVNPGTSVVAVGNVVNGGMITAKPYDDTRLKAIIKNKLMRKSLSDLI